MSDSGGRRFPFGQTNSMEMATGRGRRFRFDVILQEASRASVGASPRATSGRPGPRSCPGWPPADRSKVQSPHQEKMDAQVHTKAGGRRLNESLIAPSLGGGPGGCSHR